MKKILVIEDEKVVLLNITKILQYEGFEVIAAAKGESGIQLAKEKHPDLILCDVMMPSINGYDVQAELQQDPTTKFIPFIFLTAMAERSDMRLGMTLGANDYLTKPFTSEELLEAIFSCLDRHESVHQHFQLQVDQIKQRLMSAFPERLYMPLEHVRSCLESMESQSADHLSPLLKADLKDSLTSLNNVERFLQNFMLFSFLETTKNDSQKIQALTQNCVTDTNTIMAKISKNKAKEYGREADLQLDLSSCKIAMLEANFMNVIEEVLDNAMRFSPQNSAIHIQSYEESGQMAIVVLNHVLDQASPASNPPVSNPNGLGLEIVKQLIELHGGKVSLEREQEALFVVRLHVPIAVERDLASVSL